ncbi:hypothetical protein CN378_18695 [Bacillus sp. AFS015802]|nr:hypothetical protein CN378_18695 [Bacillus sp. AFS015802]
MLIPFIFQKEYFIKNGVTLDPFPNPTPDNRAGFHYIRAPYKIFMPNSDLSCVNRMNHARLSNFLYLSLS